MIVAGAVLLLGAICCSGIRTPEPVPVSCTSPVWNCRIETEHLDRPICRDGSGKIYVP